MKLLDGYKARCHAEDDRFHNNYQRDNRVTALYGIPKPIQDHKDDLKELEIATVESKDLILKVQECKEARTKQVPLVPLLLLILLLLVGDWTGFFLLGRDLGITVPQLYMFSFLLGTTAVYLAYRANRQPTSGPPRRQRLVFMVGWGVFALFALIVAIVRVATVTPEEGTWASELPLALLMVALTITPPLLLEHLLQRFKPALQAARAQHHYTIELRARRRTMTAIRKRLAASTKEQDRYQQRAAQYRAIYDTHYQNASGGAHGAGNVN
jgi:hypothetical protein